jgi:hypothetical protein
MYIEKEQKGKNQKGHSARRKKEHAHLGTQVRRGEGQWSHTKGNKWEKESRQKQDDMTTLGGIKGRQGPMGRHIKCTNWR